MDVAVYPARRQELALAGQYLGGGTDFQTRTYAVLDVRVTRLADGGDQAVADAHVGLENAVGVQDDGVGDDQVGGPRLPRRLALTVPDDLAAAEDRLVAIGSGVGFDFQDERRVGQPHPVAGGGAVQRGVNFPGQRQDLSASGV